MVAQGHERIAHHGGVGLRGASRCKHLAVVVFVLVALLGFPGQVGLGIKNGFFAGSGMGWILLAARVGEWVSSCTSPHHPAT